MVANVLGKVFAPQFRIGEHASYGATGLGEFKMQQRKAGIRR